MKINYFKLLISLIAVLTFAAAADSVSARGGGFGGGRMDAGGARMDDGGYRDNAQFNRDNAAVQSNRVQNNNVANVNRSVNATGRYYHNGNYYRYNVNGAYYNYYHGGAYWRYYVNGGYYNYYYNGMYYANCNNVGLPSQTCW